MGGTGWWLTGAADRNLLMDLIPANAAHWHLVLNHLPVVGSMAALLLLAWALVRNTDDLKRTAAASLVMPSDA